MGCEIYVTGPFVTTKGATIVPLSASQESAGSVAGVEVRVVVGPPGVCVGRGVLVLVAVRGVVGEGEETGVLVLVAAGVLEPEVLSTMNALKSGPVAGAAGHP